MLFLIIVIILFKTLSKKRLLEKHDFTPDKKQMRARIFILSDYEEKRDERKEMESENYCIIRYEPEIDSEYE